MASRWIATGLSADLPAGVVMAGRWEGVELAVWRSASGRLAAWNDRCPHRGMRLSHGFVRGESLACIYHGWVYGQDGGCRHIPAHPALTPPVTIRAQGYRCEESQGVIWLAPQGDLGPPPVLGDVLPIRSLGMSCQAKAITAVEPGLAGAEVLSGSVQIGGESLGVCLLVQSLPDGIMVHALAAASARPTEVSRWLEDLRRRAEVWGTQ